jgi:hypothetical protein
VFTELGVANESLSNGSLQAENIPSGQGNCLQCVELSEKMSGKGILEKRGVQMLFTSQNPLQLVFQRSVTEASELSLLRVFIHYDRLEISNCQI